MDIAVTKMYDTCESQPEDSPTCTVRYTPVSLCRGREGDTPHRNTSLPDAAECHLLLHRRAVSTGAPPLA